MAAVGGGVVGLRAWKRRPSGEKVFTPRSYSLLRAGGGAHSAGEAGRTQRRRLRDPPQRTAALEQPEQNLFFPDHSDVALKNTGKCQLAFAGRLRCVQRGAARYNPQQVTIPRRAHLVINILEAVLEEPKLARSGPSVADADSKNRDARSEKGKDALHPHPQRRS